MTIQILGSGCTKCNILEKHARDAVAELGLPITVEKISDFGRMSEMGVMMTPALAINEVVLSSGKLLTKEQIISLIQDNPVQ